MMSPQKNTHKLWRHGRRPVTVTSLRPKRLFAVQRLYLKKIGRIYDLNIDTTFAMLLITGS